MGEQYFWALFSFAVFFGLAYLWTSRRKARDARNLKVREMLHQERLTAFKEGVPLPEIPDLEETSNWFDPESDRAHAAWLRRLSLIIGLVGVTTGAGICAAFFWAPDRGFYEMWTIGFIPILAGFGFLLYVALAPRSDR